METPTPANREESSRVVLQRRYTIQQVAIFSHIPKAEQRCTTSGHAFKTESTVDFMRKN